MRNNTRLIEQAYIGTFLALGNNVRKSPVCGFTVRSKKVTHCLYSVIVVGYAVVSVRQLEQTSWKPFKFPQIVIEMAIFCFP